MSVSFALLQMCFSNNTDQYYTCLDCGKEFAQMASLSHHRGSVNCVKNRCIEYGCAYTHTTNLSLNMITHHQQKV